MRGNGAACVMQVCFDLDGILCSYRREASRTSDQRSNGIRVDARQYSKFTANADHISCRFAFFQNQINS